MPISRSINLYKPTITSLIDSVFSGLVKHFTIAKEINPYGFKGV